MKTLARSNRTVQLAFAFAIIVMLIVGGFSYRAMTVSDESGRWVKHTNSVLENLPEVVCWSMVTVLVPELVM